MCIRDSLWRDGFGFGDRFREAGCTPVRIENAAAGEGYKQCRNRQGLQENSHASPPTESNPRLIGLENPEQQAVLAKLLGLEAVLEIVVLGLDGAGKIGSVGIQLGTKRGIV